MVKYFGKDPNGRNVTRCEISNGGTRVSVLAWGATIQELRTDGMEHSLILGGRSMAAYLGPMRYFGAIVGPVANRIAGGEMKVAGRSFALDKNEAGRTTLHGGLAGFDQQLWTFSDIAASSCRLKLTHADGFGGFPGNISVATTYSLDAQGALNIEITGETDKPTYFSPAFHGYWNLSGQPDLADHRIYIPATSYLPVDAAQIPLGEPAPVAGTTFDYRQPRNIGSELDHTFCLAPPQAEMVTACHVSAAGVRLEVTTDQPGVQLYNGRHIHTGQMPGHGGAAYGSCAGLAIEPQFWPNTPHQPNFPSSLLTPGRVALHRSRFGISRVADEK
ncbi:MAG: galactose mutarotase [Roseobacter sp.]|nr:galactose mutarotase [Roseobacter sp.]MBV47465.1 galactose mutarotase [Roseobacter sp.]